MTVRWSTCVHSRWRALQAVCRTCSTPDLRGIAASSSWPCAGGLTPATRRPTTAWHPHGGEPSLVALTKAREKRSAEFGGRPPSRRSLAERTGAGARWQAMQSRSNDDSRSKTMPTALGERCSERCSASTGEANGIGCLSTSARSGASSRAQERCICSLPCSVTPGESSFVRRRVAPRRAARGPRRSASPTGVAACRPFRARTNGKTESGVGDVKKNVIAGLSFTSIAALIGSSPISRSLELCAAAAGGDA